MGEVTEHICRLRFITFCRKFIVFKITEILLITFIRLAIFRIRNHKVVIQFKTPWLISVKALFWRRHPDLNQVACRKFALPKCRFWANIAYLLYKNRYFTSSIFSKNFYSPITPQNKTQFADDVKQKPKVTLSVFLRFKIYSCPLLLEPKQHTASETPYSAFKQLYFLFYWFCR